MYHFTVPGSCKPQHDISIPFGKLYAEAVPVPVKETTLGTSLAPHQLPARNSSWSVLCPQPCWGIAWDRFRWHRAKIWKGPFYWLHGVGDCVSFELLVRAQSRVRAKGPICKMVYQNSILFRKAWEPSCHHFYTGTNRQFDHAGRIRLLEWWGMY